VVTHGFTKGPERVVYDGYVIQVAVGEFVAPNGERIERDIIHHPGAVAVVPIDGDDVILIRQYRAALGHDLLEIPAGKRDVLDEALELCAQRELAEEIGMTATSLVKVASFYNSAGFCDELSHVFIGRDLVPTPSAAHGIEEEYMTIERHRLDAVPALIASGEICDAKTIIGLLLALREVGR
jgi:ADP-ribose pyrophosphatase